MKTLLTTLFALALMPQSLFVTNTPTIQAQLTALNRYWSAQNLSDPMLQERRLLTNEVVLIQTHLSLVERSLRSKSVAHLTVAQRYNREKCLNVLHDYWQVGKFPQNTHHTARTPYFIDEFGTACAVGQLIIATGHSDFAHKIASENNYAYIKDMNTQYREIKIWADCNGFDITELAWIQPCYCSATQSGGNSNVTCFGGHDGRNSDYILAGIAPPYSIDLLACDGTWNCVAPDCPCLWAGNYRWRVTDFSGNVGYRDFVITEPDQIQITTSSTPVNGVGFCDGTATAVVQGGVQPYNFTWNTFTPQYTPTATSLCQGGYTVVVTDANGCQQNGVATVNVVVGTATTDLRTAVSVQPNPFHQTCTFTVTGDLKNADLKIYNQLGILVKQTAMSSPSLTISREGLPAGTYFYQISNADTKPATGRLVID